MSITIYGASDNLIEVEGGIREEFDYYASESPVYLAFSDGTVLRIEFDDDGVWRITPVVVPDPELLTITLAPVVGDSGHTDRAELRADCEWVVYGSAYALNKR